MSRIAYVNGAYIPQRSAAIHIEDRAHQLSDSVYEGVTIYKGKLIDLDPHFDRLWRSMGELRITEPMGRAAMRLVLKELVRQNRIQNGFLYLQVSRGTAPRDHAFPDFAVPSFTATCKRLDVSGIEERANSGVRAITHPDIRWGRCDIKSTALLPNVLAKQAAKEAGAFEAVLFDNDGYITEGSSTNIWMVTKDGALHTRPTSDNILPGITRMMVMKIAKSLNFEIIDEAFTVDEVYGASEVFLTSSTAGAVPIVTLDGKDIADGNVGPMSTALIEAYKIHLDSQI